MRTRNSQAFNEHGDDLAHADSFRRLVFPTSVRLSTYAIVFVIGCLLVSVARMGCQAVVLSDVCVAARGLLQAVHVRQRKHATMSASLGMRSSWPLTGHVPFLYFLHCIIETFFIQKL